MVGVVLMADVNVSLVNDPAVMHVITDLALLLNRVTLSSLKLTSYSRAIAV